MPVSAPIPRQLQALGGTVVAWLGDVQSTLNVTEAKVPVRVTVGTTEPESPQIGDIWVDTN